MMTEEDRRRRGEHLEARATDMRVRNAVNLFLSMLDEQLAAGKIGIAQRASYGDEIHRLILFAGKNRRMTDFCKLTAPEELFAPLRKAAVERGLSAAEKHITQIRTFLDWCSNTRRYIPAPFYADAFDVPGEKERRTARKAERRARGQAFWTPAQVREWVEAARATDVHRLAQVLLMINGGMGATDLSNLEDIDVDADRRCIHTDRSKTLVPRVIPLWDITYDAMMASRENRSAAAKPEWENRFFLTKHGKPLVVESMDKDRRKLLRSDSIKNWFYTTINAGKRKRWKEQAIRLPHLKRHRAGAYTLRSVFATLCMGHAGDRNLEAVILGQQFDRPILEFYIRDDQREKLVCLVNHVRRQIWPDQ